LIAPFLDGGRERALLRRKGAALTGLSLIAAVVLLTVLSLL